MPCNQFAARSPGSAEEIQTFCSATYGVSFPLLEKLDVNGAGRHPLYAELTQLADADGRAGDIQWNFEKFLISRTASRSPASAPAPSRRPRGHRGDRGAAAAA